MNNIYNLPTELPPEELFEIILSSSNILVERIISVGQATPQGEWYDQPHDEWVILLQGHATLSYHDSTSVDLKAGDYLLIPAHQRHRVDYTSTNPPCIWLAIHGNLSS
jgi:cupin 2 domain-containing protein